MRLHADERGQMVAGLIFVFGALLGSGVLLLLIGKGAVLRQEAVTAADSAALAAADELREQLVEHLASTAFEDPIVLDYRAARRVAQEYAQRNGAELVDFRGQALEVTVTTATRETVGSAALPDLGGRSVPDVRADTVSGTATARAIVERAGDAAPGAVKLTAVGSARAPAVTSGTGPDRPSLSELQPQMREEIVKIEAAMGRALSINSGYRSPADQVRVCAQVRSRNPDALCAPPGRSLHQAGLAIDVADPAFVLEAMRRDPSIALCQPFPARDAVHFSHASGRECGGSRDASAGAAGEDYRVRLTGVEP